MFNKIKIIAEKIKGLRVEIYGNPYEVTSDDTIQGDSIKKYPPPTGKVTHFEHTGSRVLGKNEFLFTWKDVDGNFKKGVLKVKLIEQLVKREKRAY